MLAIIPHLSHFKSSQNFSKSTDKLQAPTNSPKLCQTLHIILPNLTKAHVVTNIKSYQTLLNAYCNTILEKIVS